MLTFFKPPRRAPAVHRDVFAEFALRLIGLFVARRQGGEGAPQPRFRVVR